MATKETNKIWYTAYLGLAAAFGIMYIFEKSWLYFLTGFVLLVLGFFRKYVLGKKFKSRKLK